MSSSLSEPHSICLAIRFAREPNNPDLLHRWLAQTHPEDDHFHYWQALLAQYRLLLATLSDLRLPLSWRCHCLENIHQPLKKMECSARDEQERREVRRLYFEMKMVVRCCLPQESLH